MSYFGKYEYVNYTFPDGKQRFFKNLSIRLDLLDRVKKEDTRFQSFYVQDGDTPDIISQKVYDTPMFHWCILLANNITNIYTQWPKTNRQLENFLVEKYKKILTMRDSDIVLSREKTLEFINFVGTPSNQFQDSDNGVLYRPRHFTDSNNNIYSYESAFGQALDAFGRVIVRPTFTPVSIFTYEFDLNEVSRDIVIPSAALVEQMERELRLLTSEA